MFECTQHLTMSFRIEALEIRKYILRSQRKLHQIVVVHESKVVSTAAKPRTLCNNICFYASTGLSVYMQDLMKSSFQQPFLSPFFGEETEA